jgi:TetR/AcrR family transcriptional repressor of nem operon
MTEDSCMVDMGRAEQVLDAAEQRMRAGGYHAVSFRDVAADVGIRSASVHHHFPQKADLGRALVERYRDRFLAKLSAGWAAQPGERLRAFCDAYRQAFRAEDAVCLCGMLGAESHGLPDGVGAAVREFFAANIAWVAEALPEAVPPARRDAEAASIVAALQGAMMLAATFRDPTLLDGAIALVLERHAPG